MVISVFPDYGQAIDRYRSVRNERLERQAQETQRAAYNRLLGQVQDPAMREAMSVMDPQQGSALFAQQGMAQQQAEAERAAQLQERARAFQTEVMFPAIEEAAPAFQGMEGEERSQFLNNLTRRLNIQAQAYGGRGQATPESVGQMLAGYAPQQPDYNNPQRGINPETGREEFFVTDQRGAPRFIGVNAPARGNQAADALMSALASQIAPVSGSGNDGADAARAVLRFGGSIRNYRDMVEQTGPSGFALAGVGRRAAQNISQQILSASGISLDQLQAEAMGLARSGDNPDPELQDRIRSMFDPALSTLGPAAVLLAYQGAEAIAGQTGRALSDNDFKRFLDVVGDPTSAFSTYDGTLARLSRLDAEVLNSVNAERAVAGLPIIPRGLSFSDGSALEWVNAAPGSERAAIEARYAGDNSPTTPAPSRDGNGGSTRRRYVPGQGFVDD